MTSRERIIAALRHRSPDKVPLDLGGTESSGITAIAYNNLRKHLGLDRGKTQIFDVYQQVVKLDDDIREILRPDTVPLFIEPQNWKSFKLPDGSLAQIPENWDPEKDGTGDLVVRAKNGEVTARMPVGGYYFEPVRAPLAGLEDPAELKAYKHEIESYDWPFYADESLDAIAARAKYLFDNTDLAVVANLQLHLLAAGQQLRGYENFMIDLKLNKKMARAFLETLTDAYLRRCERYLDRVGNYVQVVLLNDDFGTQKGPMLSVGCYQEMFRPCQKRLIEFIKSKAPVFVLFHSCGSVHDFIPFFIEVGIDALNPVQVSAARMESKSLKREFGRDITFWGGGCDTQYVLRKGSAAEIRQEVKRRIEDFAPGGGFVFTQVHNIQPDVPPENIMAMLAAFRQYCDYTGS